MFRLALDRHPSTHLLMTLPMVRGTLIVTAEETRSRETAPSSGNVSRRAIRRSRHTSRKVDHFLVSSFSLVRRALRFSLPALVPFSMACWEVCCSIAVGCSGCELVLAASPFSTAAAPLFPALLELVATSVAVAASLLEEVGWDAFRLRRATENCRAAIARSRRLVVVLRSGDELVGLGLRAIGGGRLAQDVVDNGRAHGVPQGIAPLACAKEEVEGLWRTRSSEGEHEDEEGYATSLARAAPCWGEGSTWRTGADTIVRFIATVSSSSFGKSSLCAEPSLLERHYRKSRSQNIVNRFVVVSNFEIHKPPSGFLTEKKIQCRQ